MDAGDSDGKVGFHMRMLAQRAGQLVKGGVESAKIGVTRVVHPDWVPDSDFRDCSVCGTKFEDGGKHHCRACGKGVCHKCSTQSRPVPAKDITKAVRVCDPCAQSLGSGGTL
mmetsp:Transcript_17422/g.41471  ORF Transcript_17422/g.41471 Transcript_17422/m.41471 type:complete len:112 (+) Transcript_17422:91-426(+)